MKFKLEIDMSNAAFDNNAMPEREISRLLKQAAEQVNLSGAFKKAGERFALVDYNGNKVGKWDIK